jgi:hypothetical protein
MDETFPSTRYVVLRLEAELGRAITRIDQLDGDLGAHGRRIAQLERDVDRLQGATRATPQQEPQPLTQEQAEEIARLTKLRFHLDHLDEWRLRNGIIKALTEMGLYAPSPEKGDA